MPKFLNNIDLNGNQLLSPVIHTSSQSTHTNGPAGNTTGTEGQIFYNEHAKALFYRDDTAWRPVGDITGVAFTTDDGTTISDVAGSAAFTITGGAGITTSSTGSTVTIVTSNDQDTTGNAATATKLAAAVNIGGVSFDGSASITLVSGSIPNNAANTSGNAATVTTNANLTGHVTSVGNTASLGSFTTAQLNAAISDGTINSQTLPTDFVSAANGGTFSGNVSFGDNDITNVGVIKVDEIKADNATIKIGVEQSKAITIGKADTVDGSGNSNNDESNVTVGHDLLVAGELTVNGGVTLKGDVILETTTNTALKDKILLLNQGQTGAPQSTDDFGILWSRGTGTTGGKANMMIKWDESELEWQLIATTAVGTETGAVSDISGTGGEGEDVLGDSGFQHLRVGKMSSVTFHGNGASLTDLNGSAITSGTVAAARVATLNQSTTGSAGSVANSLTVDDTTVGLSSGTNYNGSTAKTISAKTASIADGGTALATADQIHTFVTTQTDAIAANTSGTASNVTGTVASANLDADTAHLSEAQTFSGAKTFSAGIVLDDGAGASPVLKFKNEADTHWTVQNDNSNNLKFTQATDLRVTFSAGGTVTIPGDIDLGGSIDVDGTMEADAITLGGNSVHATDTSTSLGTSDTVVPSQNAVKTYVDSQSSSSGNTGGRNAFSLTNAGSVAATNSGKTFTITHGMGDSLNYGVEVIRAANGSGETVYTDVTRTTTTIVINFAVAPTAGDYTALVCKY